MTHLKPKPANKRDADYHLLLHCEIAWQGLTSECETKYFKSFAVNKNDILL